MLLFFSFEKCFVLLFILNPSMIDRLVQHQHIEMEIAIKNAQIETEKRNKIFFKKKEESSHKNFLSYACSGRKGK